MYDSSLMENNAETIPSTHSIPQKHQRAYKACISCRNRKAKCDLGGREGPPCLRCHREMRQCTFASERSWKKRKASEIEDDETTNERNQHAPRGNEADPISSLHLQQTGEVDYSSGTQNSNSNNFVDSVVRTVVSTGNDALDILFQAATRDESANESESNVEKGTSPRNGGESAFAPSAETPITQPSLGFAEPAVLSPVSPELHKLWSSSRYVKMGWLSATQIVSLMDLFFQNLAPLSPASAQLSYEGSHRKLLLYEPLLTSVILMIATRHHILPGAGGVSRAYFIHDQFWKQCQGLVMRLMFGREKGLNTKLRTIGSVEGLLLLAEWHPRSLHFTAEMDGWDSDLVNEDHTAQSTRPPNQWREDVIEPARRSDRMAWMFLGCGLSLAHELLLFNDGEETGSLSGLEKQKNRLKKLLYVSINQLATRVGASSMLPHNACHRLLKKKSTENERWDVFMSGWIELTNTVKSLYDMVFSSTKFTREILHNGRYVSILDHFQPLLSQWWDNYFGENSPRDALQDILFTEYQYVRIYCNSIGMQALCERLADTNPSIDFVAGLSHLTDDKDQSYVQEVISGCCDLLSKIVELSKKNVLRYAPVRVFIRTTTAAVFLLKALAIGVRNGQLRSALEVLDQTVDALRGNVVDDVHLANRFASLLENHVRRLKQAFMVSSKKAFPSYKATRQAAANNVQNGVDASGYDSSAAVFGELSDLGSLPAFTDDDSNWLSLPFDPTMGPLFPCGDNDSSPSMLDGNGLNFLWNLQT